MQSREISFTDFQKQVYGLVTANRLNLQLFSNNIYLATEQELATPEYFRENNINRDGLYDLLPHNVIHHDLSYSSSFSYGFISTYPNPDMECDKQLTDVKKRFAELSPLDCDKFNHLSVKMFKAVCLTYYLRLWSRYLGYGNNSISNICYHTLTENIYTTHRNGGGMLVKLKAEYLVENDVINYFRRVTTALEKYQSNHLYKHCLLLTITGELEPLILNQSVIEGKKFNELSAAEYSQIAEIYNERIFPLVKDHLRTHEIMLYQEGMLLYNHDLKQIDTLKYRVNQIIEPLEQIYQMLKNNYMNDSEILDEILTKILNDDFELFVICILCSFDRYLDHDLTRLFTKACDSGLDQIVRILLVYSYSIGKPIDHNLNKDYAFLWICQRGNLPLAQFIYKLGGVNVNETFNGSAFNAACGMGHLELAKWLFSLGNVDVHAYNSDGFQMACVRKYTEVYQWLWEISETPERYFTDWKRSGSQLELIEDCRKILHHDKP